MRIKALFNALSMALSLLCFIAYQGISQQTVPEFEVEKSYVRKLGKTRPLSQLIAESKNKVDLTEKARLDKPQYVRNFIGRRPLDYVDPSALPVGKDPLLDQIQLRGGGLSVLPLVNIEGMNESETFANVPDVNGDVGGQIYVETVNATWLQAFDRQGNPVGDRFRANMIWSDVNRVSNGDPIILFDEAAQRWFLTEFPPQNEVLLAVSDSEDIMGSWTAYAMSTPRFPDYPKYGIWPEAYLLTTNEGGGQLFFYAIDRQAMLQGSDTVAMQRLSVPRPNAPGFIVATPVGITGEIAPAPGTKPLVMHMNDDAWSSEVTEDRLELFELTIDFDDEANTVVEQLLIPTTPFDAQFCSVPGPGFSCVPQPNGVGIDGIPWVVMHRAVYRNFDTHESIVLNFAIDVTGEEDAGIRWMELRKSGDEPWSVYQEGTIGSDDGLNRFMGGISIDALGNIGLAYSVSSEKVFPSLRYTGRLATDPLGTMSIEEYEFATGGGSRGNSRFGDYASMSVDLDNVFWYAGQYVLPGNQWSTKIVGFKLERSENDIGPARLIQPQDSPDLSDETVSVEVRNYGTRTQTEFEVGYIFDGGSPVTEMVTLDSLPPDSVYVHEFSSNIEFTDFRTYELTTFTRMVADSNQLNDTCVFNVRKLPRNDAGIAGIQGITGVVCDTFADVSIILENAGTDSLFSAEVTYQVNGIDGDPIAWEGALASFESVGLPITLADLVPGTNNIRVIVDMPNGSADQNAANDRFEASLDATPGGERTVLELTTDLYPEETTWELLDEDLNVIFSGGPYLSSVETFTEEWCLDSEQCFVFVLKDSYGDGITSSNVSGDFRIINVDGITVAKLDDPDFGSVDSTFFCLDAECALAANIFVSHETRPGAGNGIINIIGSGGEPPFNFSNNNGQSFQGSPLFPNLSPGQYQVVVRDDFGCTINFDIEILGCALTWEAEVQGATAADATDGSIIFMPTENNGFVEYSIDGGENFQLSPEFSDLMPGVYDIVLRDSVKCRVEDTLSVPLRTSSNDPDQSGVSVTIYPNPSEGDFYLEIAGLESELFLEYEVLDLNGRLMDRRVAGNYSGVLKSYFSIHSYPAGTYYVRFTHPKLRKVVPVVKQ